MRIDVSRSQVRHAVLGSDGLWRPYPPGTWVYVYSASVYGRRMDCVVAAQEDKSEQWVRARFDGDVIAALQRAVERGPQ